MANNANNANMDWTQPTPASAFRNGNSNHLVSPQDADVSYMIRGDASGHQSRSQYIITNEYHTNHLGHNLHPGLHGSGLGIEEHFWPQQNDPSNNIPPHSEHSQVGVTHDGNSHQTSTHDATSDQDAPTTNGPVRRQRTTVPRSERRKHYKPKPDPSHPRLFRPFAPNETKDTMLAQWRTPPIVGSYVMFPNKKLKYNPVPPDIDKVREKLFKMEQSVLLKNSQEVADYVPHITNFWRRAVQRHDVDAETGVQYEHWYCRSKRARKPPESVSKGIRNRTGKNVVMHEGKDTCKMRIRVTSFTKHADTSEDHQRWGGGACRCVAEWVYFERDCVDGDPTEHTHDQEALDEWKHSEATAIFAKIKCEEGNSYSAVAKWLRKEFGDRNKQVYKFDKGDVANAAQPWRNDHKDLVLREEVPEDSDEMITMRRCVDAMLEADADSLRAALREVCKDSDALTRTVLGVLEKSKPATSTEEQPQEPWRLTEGVALSDLPPPVVGRKMQENAGVKGPLFDNAKSTHRGQSEHGQFEPNIRTRTSAAPLGPDGRPIISSQVMPKSTVNSPNLARNGHNSNTQQQHQFPALQPRPPPNAHGGNPPPHVEIRYIQPPAESPQRGSLHPITLSMEVPSCPTATCRQCKNMSRGLAGRTFFFQDKIHTPSHFTKLQRLLRDPKQLLDNDYTRLLDQSQVPSVHQHPALHPRPVGGSVVGNVDENLQFRQGAFPSVPIVSHTDQGSHSEERQKQSRCIEEELNRRPPEPSESINTSPDGSGESVQPTPQAAANSVYDTALPIAMNVEDGNNSNNDERQQQQQHPAKRQRLESAD